MNKNMIAAIDIHVCLSRNGYVDREGRRQVVVELYQQGRRRVVNTHIHVPPSDFRCGRIQPSNADHDLLNRRIRRIVRRLLELEDEMEESGCAPTPESLVQAYIANVSRSATIEEWVASVIEPSARKRSTKDSYRTLCNSLTLFRPGVQMAQLNHDFIERWQNWLRNERHLCENTIALRLKTLRCLVSEAVKRNVIAPSQDPFRNIRIPEIKARLEHLSEQELGALGRLPLADARLGRVRDAFLFCCYTGLRWSDFTRLTTANICGDVLSLQQQKTGRTLRIPMGKLWQGKPLALLRRYATVEQLADIGTNAQCNRDLRKVGAMAGVKKHLHWHIARHTCGTLLNQHGLRMQEIQFILGHRKQETTERHYAETLLEQVERSLTRAFA